jgi:hypothetical protein
MRALLLAGFTLLTACSERPIYDPDDARRLPTAVAPDPRPASDLRPVEVDGGTERTSDTPLRCMLRLFKPDSLLMVVPGSPKAWCEVSTVGSATVRGAMIAPDPSGRGAIDVSLEMPTNLTALPADNAWLTAEVNGHECHRWSGSVHYTPLGSSWSVTFDVRCKTEAFELRGEMFGAL